MTAESWFEYLHVIFPRKTLMHAEQRWNCESFCNNVLLLFVELTSSSARSWNIDSVIALFVDLVVV